MDNEIKELLERGILEEGNIFILNGLLTKMKILPQAGIVDLIAPYAQEGDNEKIEDAYWSERAIILKSWRSAPKLALCIYCDSVINKKCREVDRHLLKLATTLIIKHS